MHRWKTLWAARKLRRAVGIRRRAAGKLWRPLKSSGVPLEFSTAPLENSGGHQKFSMRRWNSPTCHRKNLEAAEISCGPLEFSNVRLENSVGCRRFPASRWNSSARRRKTLGAAGNFRRAVGIMWDRHKVPHAVPQEADAGTLSRNGCAPAPNCPQVIRRIHIGTHGTANRRGRKAIAPRRQR